VADDDSSFDALERAQSIDGDIEAEKVLQTVRAKMFGTEPARFGRFVVLKRLGAGAQSVVYAGYDPELDRKVAIKVLTYTGQRDRLQREAKAMARLRHAHVVGVHQLGQEDGRVFVAMEHVDGSTLRQWLRDEKRSWQQVVDVFIQAGRGLAAAHDAALIHRDFKPDNVLITSGGDARVADFGLVRISEDDGDISRSLDETTSTPQAPTVMGTPAYMAPEVFAGNVADAQSDQFSFCVALYEALYGKRPFAGDTLLALVASVTKGALPDATVDSRVPARLRAAVARGLAPDPSERFGSMAELIGELELARTKRRGRILGLGVVVVVAAGVIVALSTQQRASKCEAGPAELAGIWDDDRKAAVEQAFRSTGTRYAADTLATTVATLDVYARQWLAMYKDACEATHVHGEQSAHALDLRMACLQRRLSHLRGLSDVLAKADAEVVLHAADAADALVPVSGCADYEALASRRLVPDDLQLRAKVATMRNELAAAAQLGLAGKHEDALPAVEHLCSRADELDFAPLRAESYRELAVLQEAAGDFEAALTSLRKAFAVGMASHQDDIAAWAAIRATHLVGFRLREPKRGYHWTWLAKASIARAGSSARMRATLMRNLANVFYAEGKLDKALNGYRRSLRLSIDTLGPDHRLVGETRSNLGSVLRKVGRTDEAREQLEEAERIMTAALGKNHPNLGRVLNAIANVHAGDKRYGEAARYHERALALKTSSLRADHPSIGHSLNNLGEVLLAMGELARAEEHFDDALALWSNSFDDDHPLLAHPLRNLGAIYLSKGEPERARPLLERAFSIAKTKSSEGDRGRGEWLLAQALVGVDEDRAVELAQSAVARLGDTAAFADDAAAAKAWLESRAAP